MRKLSETFGLEVVVPFLLGDNSPKAQHYAAEWIYNNYAALAYSGFLKHGRGVLVGPIAKGEDGRALDCASLQEAVFETGDWAISVSYFAAAQQDFGTAVPEGGIRNILMPVLRTYDPELEVPILLMRDGQARALFPEFRGNGASPRDLYDAISEPAAEEQAGFTERVAIPGKRRRSQRSTPALVPAAAI